MDFHYLSGSPRGYSPLLQIPNLPQREGDRLKVELNQEPEGRAGPSSA